MTTDLMTSTAPPPAVVWDKWLKDRLDLAAASPDRIYAEVWKVTPELAAYLLGHNPDNRNLKPSRVRLYAEMMLRGVWKLNGQAIIIAATGELNDGQNRLQAVIESGVSVEMLFIFGVERESRTSLDMGLNRNIGDILTMCGFTGGGPLGTFVEHLMNFERHRQVGLPKALAPTRDEIMAYVQNHQDLIDELGEIKASGWSTIGLTRAEVAFCRHAIETETGRADVMPIFFDKMLTGANLAEKHPIKTARDRLMRDRKINPTAIRVETVFRAWNAMRRREHPSRFLISGGVLPYLES